MVRNNLIFLFAALLMVACKKEVDAHIPPDVQWIQTAGHTYGDNVTAAPGDTLLVGVKATLTEDPLKSLNVSVAYDGSNSTETFYNEVLQESDYNGFSRDVQIIMRDTTGTEKWIFSIVDRDGNITQKKMNITVQ